MANIRPGREIASIEFWEVEDAGSRLLQRLCEGMIATRNWPAQTEEAMPPRTVLGEITLTFHRGFPFFF